MKSISYVFGMELTSILFLTCALSLQAQPGGEKTNVDKRVKNFLDGQSWYNMNVPRSDGEKLYNLIIENNYTRALEIGTSTGHSAIWIAWAMSKTGGKLITIEIDEDRYNKALKNFRDAGVSKYIDARLANAHDMVPNLEESFDFVFSDADKDWYKNYFLAIDPQLKVGGCYVSHNVSENGTFWNSKKYLEFLRSLPNYQTTVYEKGAGMSISYKKSAK